MQITPCTIYYLRIFGALGGHLTPSPPPLGVARGVGVEIGMFVVVGAVIIVAMAGSYWLL